MNAPPAVHLMSICLVLLNCAGTWHFVAVLTLPLSVMR